jgi:hypothetical protein
LYITSTLAHSVNFGLFEIDACNGGSIAYYGGNGENALSSHAS